MTRRAVWLVVAALLAGGCSGGGNSHALKIGVLHLGGPGQSDWRKAVEWATENVNAAGGVAGKRIELVYRDTSGQGLDKAALELAQDPTVAAVIGPQTSDEVFRVAKPFVDAQTVLVSPSATAGELYRAFHQYPFFWRTAESDIAQARLLVELAARGGSKRVALLTSTDLYGTTFFDWFGFYSDELGLQVTAEERWSQQASRCGPHVDAALRDHPQALIAVPSSVAVADCIVRRWRQVGQGTKLLFSDSAENPAFLAGLGRAADGIEGVAPEAPPDNGFDAAFRARFGHDPPPYAANAYDALTLVAYGLQASHGRRGHALARAMQEVVRGRGRVTSWDAAGVSAALTMLRRGGHPDVSGAAGPLVFDERSHTEPVTSTFREWVVRGGRFRTLRTFSTGAVQGTTSARRLEREHEQIGGRYAPAARRGLWAVLVAGSSGWENYRHQADVLAQYRLLRDNGVPDSHIVLVSANDLADARQNPTPGVVRYQPGGPNLERGVHVDYSLHGMTAKKLLDILVKLPTSRNDDVYVFLAGHGNRKGFYLGLNGAIPRGRSGYSALTPSALAAAARKMRYRRLLIAVEACQGGTMGTKLDARGAAVLAGASPTEDSRSTGYDAKLGTWPANEFASSLWHIASSHPGWTLGKTFEAAYLAVRGSHVSLYAPRFGSLRHVTIGEFFKP